MAVMVEFAAMMFMQRRNNLKKENKVEIKGPWMEERRSNKDQGKDSYEMEKLIAKIDGFALVAFTSCYILFNLFYWVPYLSTI